MADENTGTLLQKKKKIVKFDNDEIVVILRAAYLNHHNIQHLTTQARQLYQEGTMKQLRDRMSTKLSSLLKKDPNTINDENIRTLVERVRAMERRHMNQQRQEPGPAREAEHGLAPVRGVEPVREPERVPAPGPSPGPAREPERGQAHVPPRELDLGEGPGPAQGQIRGPGHGQVLGQPRGPLARRDPREALAAGLSDEDDDNAPRLQLQQPRQRKRPLAELIRENQELYHTFMTRKMPKVLREFGINSDSE